MYGWYYGDFEYEVPLKPYEVILLEHIRDGVIHIFDCEAMDADDAIDRALEIWPESTIIRVW